MDQKAPNSTVGLERRSFIKSLGALIFLSGLAGLVSASDVEQFSINWEGKIMALSDNGECQPPEKAVKTEEEWRQLLSPEQFKVMRKKGTEPPFSGKYHNFKGKGVYRCAGCGNSLFSSETKFDSGTGWPSFWVPICEHHIRTTPDNSLSMMRTEVLCNRCDAHLGHVFKDGPPPTGLRYCINSVALTFVPQRELDHEA